MEVEEATTCGLTDSQIGGCKEATTWGLTDSQAIDHWVKVPHLEWTQTNAHYPEFNYFGKQGRNGWCLAAPPIFSCLLYTSDAADE